LIALRPSIQVSALKSEFVTLRQTAASGLLSGLTAEMRDHEGLQGLFWASVEANRRPFRQAFAFALTKFNEVLTAWHVTALISTETYLKGTKAPGLMSNAGEVAIVERNTVVTTA